MIELDEQVTFADGAKGIVTSVKAEGFTAGITGYVERRRHSRQRDGYRSVDFADEGLTWARGWNTHEAAAVKAAWAL